MGRIGRKPTIVLITGMGSTTAISVAKGLRRQRGFSARIVGTDTHQPGEIAGATFCDVFYTVPPASREDYIAALCAVCEREHVRVLFPIVDAELPVIAAALPAFQALGVHVWVSTVETIEICNDKFRTYQFLRERRFPTPWTLLGHDGSRAPLPFPLVVKPRNGVGSVGVYRAENEEELRAAIRRTADPLIQEFVDGPEYTVDLLSDMRGKSFVSVPRERTEVRAGISYRGRTVNAQELSTLCESLADALEIRGASNIQCRMSNGKPKVIEVNPRFSASLPLTIAAGVNGPVVLTELARGGRQSVRKLRYRAGTTMTRYWEECFSRDADAKRLNPACRPPSGR